MKQVPTIILDTDMDTDCDDVGALAVLHTLSDKGLANLLGVICDVPVPWGARCITAINQFRGRPGLPVGEIKASLSDEPYESYKQHRQKVGTARLYNKVIGERARPPYCIQDGVELYRKLLAEQPDGSVIICCIGLLSVLAKLLQSQADQYSNLSGEQLVSRKVTKLVTMGKGALPDGKDGFNWIMDKQAAAVVLNNWPVPIAVSSFGSSIMTGDAEVSGLEEAHPVHQAYRIFLQTLFARPSWDQVAVLYAVYGQQMFQEVTGLTIQYSADTGEHSWSSIEGGRKDLFIIPGRPNEEMEKIIEKLMVAK